MNARDLGFVAARCLAIVLLLLSLTSALEAAGRAFEGYDWHVLLLPASRALGYFVFAGILWRSAGQLGVDGTPEKEGIPLTEHSAMRITLTGVAVYVMLTRLGAVVNCAWAMLALDRPNGWRVDNAPYSIAEVVEFFAALCAVPIVARMRSLRHAIAYPRLEPDDPE